MKGCGCCRRRRRYELAGPPRACQGPLHVPGRIPAKRDSAQRKGAHMTALTKAQLGEITSGDNPTEVAGTLVDVQFNPTTLRVQISNRTAGGQQAGAQARQRPGTGEMQVSFDLVFDTADEGSTEDA